MSRPSSCAWPAAAAFAVGLLAGCSTPTRIPILELDAAVSPVLILSPIARNNQFQPTAARLGDCLYRAVAQMTRGDVIAAWNVPELSLGANVDNLAGDGAVRIDEVAAMGAVAGCRTVVLAEVLDADPYAPQRLHLTGYLVDVATAAPLRRKSFPIDGGDPRVRAGFNQFVTAGAPRRNPHLSQNDRTHLADLSPRAFERYVAFLIARELIAPP